MNGPETRRRLCWLLVLGAAALPAFFLAQLWWLDSSQFHVLAGDDVRCFAAALKGFGTYNDLMISFLKFRPVTALVIRVCALLTGGEYGRLIMLGVGLHTLNATLFFFLLWKVLKVSPISALGLTILAAFNRFTAYLITPELALMEGSAITCYLIFLWALLRLMDTARLVWALVLVATFLIILHVHERYMVLAGVCLLAGVFVFQRNRSAGLVAGAGALAALAANLLAKKLYLHTPILVGTETRAIGFDFAQLATFLADGASNLVGINRGPSNLSVLDIGASTPWTKILSGCAAILSLFLLCSAFMRTYRASRSWRVDLAAFRILAVLLCLVVVLLLSASITFRQEYRWLYPAYLTFLPVLALGWKAGESTRRLSTVQVATAAMFIVSLPMELNIRVHRDNYYGRTAYNLANSLYSVFAQAPELYQKKEVVIGGDSLPAANFVFMGNDFETFYHLPHLVFADQAPPRPAANLPPPSIIYQQIYGTFDLPSPVGESQIDPLAVAALIRPASTVLPTPNGRYSFRFVQNGVKGWGLASPGALEMPVPAGTQGIEVTYSHCWAKGDGLDLVITAQSGEGQFTGVLALRVPALAKSDKFEWHTCHVILPRQCRRIRLLVESRTGDQTADWIFIKTFRFE